MVAWGLDLAQPPVREVLLGQMEVRAAALQAARAAGLLAGQGAQASRALSAFRSLSFTTSGCRGETENPGDMPRLSASAASSSTTIWVVKMLVYAPRMGCLRSEEPPPVQEASPVPATDVRLEARPCLLPSTFQPSRHRSPGGGVAGIAEEREKGKGGY